jgi:hypothetical protein
VEKEQPLSAIPQLDMATAPPGIREYAAGLCYERCSLIYENLIELLSSDAAKEHIDSLALWVAKCEAAELARRAIACDAGELPDFSARYICRKCGSENSGARYCPGSMSMHEARPGNCLLAGEHMHRTCQTCGYESLCTCSSKTGER